MHVSNRCRVGVEEGDEEEEEGVGWGKVHGRLPNNKH